MELIGILWSGWIIRPMVNSLALLYSIFFNNFGISIIAFTIIVRAMLIPLSVKQARQMKSLSGLQPRIKEAQGRYSNDKQRLSQETMRIYKEAGVNPLGCLGPLFVQMPIWIGLFWALRTMLPSTPESLVTLSGKLYRQLPLVNHDVPLDSSFLWLDLGSPDPTPILPIMVGLSMWLMQKVTTMPSADARQQSTNRMMLWMMPLMFGFFTTQFESGLALYWVISNIVGMVIQGFITGWGPLTSLVVSKRGELPAEAPALLPSGEETVTDEDDRDDGQDRRRSNRNRPKGARRRARRGRSRRR